MKIIGIADTTFARLNMGPFFSLGIFLRWLGSAKKKMAETKKPPLTCSKNEFCCPEEAVI